MVYSAIEGFAQVGQTFSDAYYGDKIRRYLHHEYKGGPIVIGSDQFKQGKSPQLPDMPIAQAACEGPPVEIAFSLASWLKHKKLGNEQHITLFTPGEVIAEYAGPTILNTLLPMIKSRGFHYKNQTMGIKRLYKDGMDFHDGSSVDAELKIVLPNWEAHSFLKDLPFVDDQGFVVTDRYMRNPDFRDIFAVGDAASLTVPKLGALGHMQAEIVTQVIANELSGKNEQIAPFSPMVICYGDMGDHQGFYMHTNEWWGGEVSVLKMGYMPYTLKVGFKNLYYLLGGKIPHWGLPLSELLLEKM